MIIIAIRAVFQCVQVFAVRFDVRLQRVDEIEGLCADMVGDPLALFGIVMVIREV